MYQMSSKIKLELQKLSSDFMFFASACHKINTLQRFNSAETFILIQHLVVIFTKLIGIAYECCGNITKICRVTDCRPRNKIILGLRNNNGIIKSIKEHRNFEVYSKNFMA